MKIQGKYVTAVFHALWLAFVGVLVVVIAALIMLQSPTVQTRVSEMIVGRLLGRIDGFVTYDKIHFKPFNTLVFKNLTIRDKMPYIPPEEVIEKLERWTGPQDTLFHAEYVVVQLSLAGLLNPDEKNIDIHRAQVKNGCFYLVLEDGRPSLARMLQFPMDRVISHIADPSGGTVIRIGKVELDKVDFWMLNYKRSAAHYVRPGSVNWTDFRCEDVTARGRDLLIKDGVVSGEMLSCSFRERCGLDVRKVKARFDIREDLVNIEDIYIEDQYSKVNVPYFRMVYDGAEAFQDYVGQVRMVGCMDNTVIDTRTVDFYGDICGSEGMVLKLTGIFDGTVDDFRLKNLWVESEKDRFKALLNAHAYGLPFVENTGFEVDIRHLRADDRSIEKIVRVFGREKLQLPSFVLNEMSTRITGRVNDLQFETDIQSDLGHISLQGGIAELVSKASALDISLKAHTDPIRLDRLVAGGSVGALSMNTSLHGQLSKEDVFSSDIAIDSIAISSLNLLGYDYHDIDLRGRYSGRDYDGTFSVADKNLRFNYEGLATLIAEGKDRPAYHFKAGLDYADLYALGFDARGRSRAHMNLTADMDIDKERRMSGTAELEDIILENASGPIRLGEVKAQAFTETGEHRVSLRSEMMQADFSGNRSLLHFLGKSLPALLGGENGDWDRSRYKLEASVLDIDPLLSFLSPGMSIEQGTFLNASINTQGQLSGQAQSRRISIGENDIRDLDIALSNPEGVLEAKAISREVDFGQFAVKDIDLQLWADLSDPARTLAGLEDSRFEVGGQVWDIRPCEVELTEKDGVRIKGFAVKHRQEGILVDGSLGAADGKDTLAVAMNQFDLGLISGLLGDDVPDFSGKVTGEALIGKKNGRYGADADILCDSCRIETTPLGTLLLSSAWDPDLGRYNLLLDNSYNERPSFEFSGSYSPYTDEFFLSGDLKKMRIDAAAHFVTDIFNRLEGSLSGLVTAEGKLGQMKEVRLGSSDLSLEGTLGIAYTGVAYQVQSPLYLDNQGIWFNNASLSDRYGNKGRLRGGILWNNFTQPSADLHIKVEKTEVIDIKERESQGFYGHIFGTGNVDITGPFNKILIDVNASTGGANSDSNITLDNNMEDAGGTLLRFRSLETEERHDRVVKSVASTPSGDLTVKLNLDVTPDVTAHIDIDKLNGSRITAHGSGNILVDVQPSRDILKLGGNYNISEGKVRFVALGLTARDLTVTSGSNVSFAGEVMDTELDINAIYKTKASISPLLTDSTAVSNRRNVEGIVHVSDKLRDPKLSFSINIPDLEPSVKSQIESAFSTEDKVQKQFLALLVMGTFLPDEQGGIVNNTASLYTNVSELMMTQINNIFAKLDIPLDLGFNYQPGTSGGNSVFDVAVSTQLFNNRVVVNGSVGNKQMTGTTGNTNEIVGDIDIEVKLNKAGSLRMSAFSHSADQYTNYLDNLQRTGLGISWQREFNNFATYMKRLFSKRETRSLLEQQEERRLRSAGVNSVTIE
ncbi:MAG: translocation/assembly module TamB domain-containing protein [Bacteroidales bacterium]|nr:translocation/assembly module TamB domain-containing protein [Bacteroidales bacterium]